MMVSQAQPDLHRDIPKYASYNDLDDTENGLCDGLIIALAECNHTGQGVNDENRKKFWGRVFTGWNTKSINPTPEGLRSRAFADFALQVGYLNQYLPSSSATAGKNKRKHGQASPASQIEEHRKHRAPAYLKPILVEDKDMVGWEWVDAQMVNVHQKYVDFATGWTRELARSEAIQRWDRNERKRIGEYNMAWAIHFGRNRLIAHLIRKSNPAALLTVRVSNNQLEYGLTLPFENMGKFVTVRTCSEILRRQAAVWRNIEGIEAISTLMGQEGGNHESGTVYL